MSERQTTDDTPLAVAGCLVFDELGRLLLLKRHSAGLGGGRWAVPGGKQEPGEAAAAAVRREVAEETSIVTGVVECLGRHEIRMPHGPVRMKTYKTVVPSDTAVTLNPEEHEAFRWFELPELLTAEGVIWALPTMLRDFGLIEELEVDPTLADGSTAMLRELKTR